MNTTVGAARSLRLELGDAPSADIPEKAPEQALTEALDAIATGSTRTSPSSAISALNLLTTAAKGGYAPQALAALITLNGGVAICGGVTSSIEEVNPGDKPRMYAAELALCDALIDAGDVIAEPARGELYHQAGVLLRLLGQLDLSISAFKEAAGIFQRTDTHPDLELSCLRQSAIALHQAGRLADALECASAASMVGDRYWIKVGGTEEGRPGANDDKAFMCWAVKATHASIQHALAVDALANGNRPAAIFHAKSAAENFALAESLTGKDPFWMRVTEGKPIIRPAVEHALYLLDLGKFAEAETVIQKALSGREAYIANKGPDRPDDLNTASLVGAMIQLGRSAISQEDTAPALAAIASFKAALGKNPLLELWRIDEKVKLLQEAKPRILLNLTDDELR